MMFRNLGDTYVITDADHGIEYHVSALRRERSGELIGELRVCCGIIGAKAVDGVLSEGSLNFSSVPARSQRAKLLGERARANGKIDFLEQLEEVCQRTNAAERTGRPGVLLRNVSPATPNDLYDVHGWRFPRRHLTIPFGPGGTMKSYLTLWALGTLAQTGVHVGLCDWELDEHEHSLREQLLFPDNRPDIHYLRCARPLIYELPRIQQWKHKHQIEVLGLDSVAYSTAGAHEDSEAAMAWMRAFRSLDVTGIAIAHVRKDGANPAEAKKYPFGSIIWHNSARCTWFVKDTETAADGVKTIGLFNKKMNLSGKQPALAFAIDLQPSRTEFRRVDVRDVAELADSLPLWQRMREVIRRGPETLAVIANELNHRNAESLDRIVPR